MDDISVLEFTDVLRLLAPMPEATKIYDHWGTKCYTSQKAHMVIWFESQTGTGTGAFTREKGNNSARACYNRLLNVGALVWIADALGEDAEKIKAAADAATIAEKENYRKRCGAFRDVIPFDRILELLENPKDWRLDADLIPYLSFNDDGYPKIKKGKKTDVELVIEGELG